MSWAGRPFSSLSTYRFQPRVTRIGTPFQPLWSSPGTVPGTSGSLFISRDCADRRAGVDTEESRLAVNLCPHEEMILARTLKGQGLELCAFPRVFGNTRRRGEHRTDLRAG